MIKILLLSLCLMSQAMADESSIQKLRAFLARSSTLQADFKQVVINEKGIALQKAEGVFYLQRPGKFRWDYASPYHQQIISNGGKVWFYDVDLEQVTVKKLNAAIGSTPALLLSGDIPLEKNFTIEGQGENEGLYWIKLLPKEEESGFKYVLLGLEGDTLSGMQLSDHFGQLTRIYFSKFKTGSKLDASLFEFKAPSGVDVFEDK